ncbi:MAG: hypothetical protein M0T79_06320 [Actinomycetota bacterium]|nr:hypothetical protein [Actinomycetota bacterium]
MRLPIDTSGMTFLAASEPEPLMQHDSDRQRLDRDGQPLVALRLVALAGGDAEILSVRLAGVAPKGIGAGTPVRCTGLSATPWQMADRAGITYRAERVEPVAPGRQAS